MTKRYRSLLFVSLIPAFLVLGGYAVLKAQQRPSGSLKRWSDPATWPDKKVPGKGALVSIGRDMNVVLDVSPPPLHGLTINGKLSFADNKDLELTTEWIMVHGELEIGTEAKPHPHQATIPSPTTSKTRILAEWAEMTAATAGSCSWAEP